MLRRESSKIQCSDHLFGPCNGESRTITSLGLSDASFELASRACDLLNRCSVQVEKIHSLSSRSINALEVYHDSAVGDVVSASSGTLSATLSPSLTSIATSRDSNLQSASLNSQPFTEADDDQEHVQDLFSLAIGADTEQTNQAHETHNELSTSVQSLKRTLEPLFARHNSTLQDVMEDLCFSGDEEANPVKFPASQVGQQVQETNEKKSSQNISLLRLAGKRISISRFSNALKELPRVSGERLRWVSSLNINGEIARLLKKGNLLDGLHGLKSMSDAEAKDHVAEVCEKFSKLLPRILADGFRKLRELHERASRAKDHVNTKFSMDSAFLGRFATLDDFYNGPEALIGVPNPRIFEGAQREHCHRKNSGSEFTSSNYNITTCPRLEWEIVVCPKPNFPYPHAPRDREKWTRAESFQWKGEHGRDVIPLEELLSSRQVREEVEKSGLVKEEVICLRLYTGPMFLLYNAALRHFPPHHVDLLNGNRYETTIFVITSGITKLSKVSGLPQNRKMYRGLGGDMVLPDNFWKRFEECQVKFSVHAETQTASDIAFRSFCEHIKVRKRKIMTSATEVLCKYVEVGRAGSATDDTQFQLVPCEMRVICDPHLEDHKFTVILSLSLSRAQLQHRQQAMLKEAIALVSGRPVSDVVIEEMSFKPKDFKGGVEFGFLSVTTSLETALSYSLPDGKCGWMFEIEVGTVDVGASVNFLSQYPDENEYLMPPLSCLEVTGEPRVHYSDFGESILLPMKVNVNLKAATVENLVRRRKELYLSISKNLSEELHLFSSVQTDSLEDLFALRRECVVESLRSGQLEGPNPILSVEKHIVRFSGRRWGLAGAPYMSASSGKFYYEVEITKAVGHFALGLAGNCFRGQKKVDIGDNELSWGVYSFGKSRHNGESMPIDVDPWFLPSNVIGLAVDLETGQVLFSSQNCVEGQPKDSDRKESEWIIVHENLFPSGTIGSAIFPIFSGGWGTEIKYNFGHDPNHRPMVVRPPSKDFRPFSDCSRLPKECDVETMSSQAARLLDQLNSGREMLPRLFEDARRKQAAIGDEKPNEDKVFKNMFNEMFDLKVGLEGKLACMMTLLEQGAIIDQIMLCRDAPAEDFRDYRTLQSQFPAYSWRLVFSGWFRFLPKVCIPLDSPPSLAALVWRAVFDSSVAVKMVSFGLDREIEVSDMVPTLRLRDLGLHYLKYERAMVGFVLAVVSMPRSRSGAGSSAKYFDFRGHEYTSAGSFRLAAAVLEGLRSGVIVGVNGLSMDIGHSGGKNRLGVRRVDATAAANGMKFNQVHSTNPFSGKQDLEPPLPSPSTPENSFDAVDLSFILNHVRASHCESLDLSSVELDPTSMRLLSLGIAHIHSLTSLSLNSVAKSSEASISISECILSLPSLASLSVASNNLGPEGATNIALRLSCLKALRSFSSDNNGIEDAGARAYCSALSKLHSLTCLSLADNRIGEAGGAAISQLLGSLTNLESLNLGGQDIGKSAWLVLTAALPRLQSMHFFYGSVEATFSLGASLHEVDDPLPSSKFHHHDPSSRNPHRCLLQLPESSLLHHKGTEILMHALQHSPNVSLTSLDLSGNRLLDSGATALGDCLASLTALSTLKVSDNQIGNVGAASIGGNLSMIVRLSNIDFGGNDHAWEGWLAYIKGLESISSLMSLNGWDGVQSLVLGGLTALEIPGKEVAPFAMHHIASSCSTLAKLDVSSNGIQAVDDGGMDLCVRACAVCTALTFLSLEDNALGALGGSAVGDCLSHLTLLETLSLRHTHLGPEGAEGLSPGLASATRLRVLLLGDASVSDGRSLFRSLQALQDLRELELAANHLDPEAADGLCMALQCLTRLERLDLSENGLDAAAATALGSCLPHLAALELLRVGTNPLTSAGATAVQSGAALLPRLRTVDLRAVAQGRLSSDFVAGLARLTGVASLDLGENGVGPEAVAGVLTGLGRSASLTRLVLSGNRLSSAGSERGVPLLSALSSLQHLELEDASLGAGDCPPLLDALARLPTLAALNLSRNPLGPEGGAALGRGLPGLRALASLDLEACGLGPAGAAAVVDAVLLALPALRGLSLGDNHIGPEAMQACLARLAALAALRADLRGNEAGPPGSVAARGGGRPPRAAGAKPGAGGSAGAGAGGPGGRGGGPATMLRRGSEASTRGASQAGMRGWLYKLNGGREADIDADEAWRERMCFIAGGQLMYKSAKKKGEVEVVGALSAVASVARLRERSRAGRHVFKVDMAGGRRAFIFAAESPAQCDEWVAALAPVRAARAASLTAERPAAAARAGGPGE